MQPPLWMSGPSVSTSPQSRSRTWSFRGTSEMTSAELFHMLRRNCQQPSAIFLAWSVF
jgi:hypothetical protein